MTVKELKEQLTKFPDSMEVITQEDSCCPHIESVFSHAFLGSDTYVILSSLEETSGKESLEFDKRQDKHAQALREYERKYA